MNAKYLLERSHYNAEIAGLEAGSRAIVAGWVRKRRNLGQLVFVDLYDRTGILQVTFDPEQSTELHEQAADLKRESVITVEGTVALRPPEAVNESMETGRVELRAEAMTIHSVSKVPPFHLIGDQEVAEELRLKYRYLDLRRSERYEVFRIRHEVQKIIRDFYCRNGFLEVVTPDLIRSTPEGARDFLVPSRLHKGLCYALPQSPQMLKQILMISGFDRYFQIVKCFRDEDSRADRQPEFTQLDVEMSFTSQDTLFRLHEELMFEIFKSVLGKEIAHPFRRIPYVDAMDRYGSDKPDLRFGIPIHDITCLVENSGFAVTDNIINDRGFVRCLVYPGGSNLSRKEMGDLENVVKQRGAGGLIMIKCNENGELSGSPLLKYLNPDKQTALKIRLDCKPNDMMCCVAALGNTGAWALGDLRLYIAKKEKLISGGLEFAWITEFPIFEFIPEENRYQAMHHPFTAPQKLDFMHSVANKAADSDNLKPELRKAQAYDLVLNGVELGGGSVRIHDPEIQEKVFGVIGISREEAERRFGFFLEALGYGTPPHCGIALGIDRLLMLLVGTDNLRDVIPFPKTLQGVCLLTQAPSPVTKEQLKTLNLKWIQDLKQT